MGSTNERTTEMSTNLNNSMAHAQLQSEQPAPKDYL